ncbi:SRPBCC domain-containing protein [Ornithinimicrobium sp. Arc0846-15]|nr:SRPBCC domain-containing protein [Ornithinimicrobium laminariae]
MNQTQNTTSDYAKTEIAADERVPAINITRDFRATPAQLMRAHTDPELFRQWVGPASVTVEIDLWDARTLGCYRYGCLMGEEMAWFRGTFPLISDTTLVQTFCYEGMPEAIALETMTLEDLGDGWTRVHSTSLVDSFEGRDQMLASGMDTGVNDGFAKLDALLTSGAV